MREIKLYPVVSLAIFRGRWALRKKAREAATQFPRDRQIIWQMGYRSLPQHILSRQRAPFFPQFGIRDSIRWAILIIYAALCLTCKMNGIGHRRRRNVQSSLRSTALYRTPKTNCDQLRNVFCDPRGCSLFYEVVVDVFPEIGRIHFQQDAECADANQSADFERLHAPIQILIRYSVIIVYFFAQCNVGIFTFIG